MNLKQIILAILVCLPLTFSSFLPASADFTINARAAVLMDPVSGRVLFGQNEHQRLPPASVTKVMTMLLIMEAVDSGRIKWTDIIPTTRAAAEMGGSQVYLKEGEEMTLREMFKAIAVVSANDASTAVAEYLYGSDQDFITAMNDRAVKLGLNDTHFNNETGLPDPKHYSSAYDLAVISRELLKHPEILQYTSIWLDSLRGGKFMLRNTNELIKIYPGADGLKTGHTDEAKFCLSATAKRNGLRLLSVILGVNSNAERILQTRRLLDYGFRTFQWKLIKSAKQPVGNLYIREANPSQIPVKLKSDFGILIERGSSISFKTRLTPLSVIKLPMGPNRRIGTLEVLSGNKLLDSAPVYTTTQVNKANFLVRGWRAFWDFLGKLFTGRLFKK